jgi:hypothetical protein
VLTTVQTIHKQALQNLLSLACFFTFYLTFFATQEIERVTISNEGEIERVALCLLFVRSCKAKPLVT